MTTLYLCLLVHTGVTAQTRYFSYTDQTGTVDSFAFKIDGTDERYVIAPGTYRAYPANKPIDFIQFGAYRGDSLLNLLAYWIDGDSVAVAISAAPETEPVPYTLSFTGSPFIADFTAFTKSRFNSYEAFFDAVLRQIEKYQGSPAQEFYVGIYLQSFQNNTTRDQQVYALVREQPDSIVRHFTYEADFRSLERRIMDAPVIFESFSLYDTLQDLTPLRSVLADSTAFIILDFWFLACPPCLIEHQTMRQRLVKTGLDARTQLIGIAVEEREDFDTWKQYVQQEQLPWLQLTEDQGIDDIYTESLGIASFPTYYLLDRSGKLLAQSTTFARIIEELYWAQQAAD